MFRVVRNKYIDLFQALRNVIFRIKSQLQALCECKGSLMSLITSNV